LRVALLVLNYDGEQLLKECLPSIIEAGKASSHQVRIIVIDNLSRDRSIEVLESDFVEVEVVKARENRYLISYNEVLESIEEDIVILLNNDIKVDRGFIDPLVSHFEDKNLFYVAPKVLNFDKTFNGGKSYLKMKYGIINVEIDRDTYNRAGETHTIAGGAFRRDMFIRLGGYDPLYLPGYWEDTDICYRALKRGLKGLYEPRSIIYHKEHASFSKKFSLYEKMSIVDRNMFLFMWKNITDPLLWCEHIVLLIPRLLFALVSRRSYMLIGFVEALRKIPEIINRSRLAVADSTVSDRAIIK